MAIRIDSHRSEVDQAVLAKIEQALETCGIYAEGRASDILTQELNKNPQSWYHRTGALRNSINHAVDLENRTMYVGTNMEYAPYVEFGTGIYYDNGGRRTSWVYYGSDGKFHLTNGMKARPFLKPAIERYRSEYEKIISDTLGQL